ncbi:unnamed protein product [Phaedon cochleariae]|uniref:Receptor-binding cancer antigen n=1 Tax=Phaedon cochleariae TaxID=80249 RepID=A0A9P0DM39_PHACE|nr:unnamed protein product [Phaedon cochleariae]
MILTIVFNKLKSFIIILLNVFGKALCCFRKRRRNSCDSIPLTHVISNEPKIELQNWNDWGDGSVNQEPKTVQDHIEVYRQQKALLTQQVEDTHNPEESANFFEDMMPHITKQTKVLIGNDQGNIDNGTSRLNFIDDCADTILTAELREWEDSSGWENEHLDHLAQTALREKKKQDRERKAWEQQQKRLEKAARSLGSRLST